MSGTMVNVYLPRLDESESAEAAEVTVSFWPVQEGARLWEGDDLLEVVTDKANFVVPSPVTGVLHRRCVREDDRIRTGDLVAIIEQE